MDKIRLEVYRQNFKLYIPNKMYKGMMNDFTSRLVSYNKMFDRKKKRYISILDKKWWVQRNLGHETMFIFQIELIRDILLFFKIQGVDTQNPNIFQLSSALPKETKDADLKLKSFYELRDYQNQYKGAVLEGNMRKALIELQTGRFKEKHLLD